MVAASPEMTEYFNRLKGEVARLHDVASKARQKSFDPDKKVEIAMAENMAERVVGLISVIAPVSRSRWTERDRETQMLNIRSDPKFLSLPSSLYLLAVSTQTHRNELSAQGGQNCAATC